jgi:monoamine oxidase
VNPQISVGKKKRIPDLSIPVVTLQAALTINKRFYFIMTTPDMPRRSFLRGAVTAAAAAPAIGLFSTTEANAAPATDTTPMMAVEQDAPINQDRWQACLTVARRLVLVGPKNEDLKLSYLKILIEKGLPRTTARKKIVIVGAGIAGLTAAWLLRQAGHEVVVIEANANRIGGRIKTFRYDPKNRPSEDPPFKDRLLSAEAGAMRLPSTHPLTLALVDKLGLKRRQFYNVDVDPATIQQTNGVPQVRYRALSGETWVYGGSGNDFVAPGTRNCTWMEANGLRVRRSDYEKNPQAFNAGFGLSGTNANTSTATQLAAALTPVGKKYGVGSPDGGEGGNVDKLVEGWARLIYDLDDYSMDRFLREKVGLDAATVDALGTVQNLTSRLSLSFLHSYQSFSRINPSMTYWELVGGTAELPYALLPKVSDLIKMNRRLVKMEFYDPAYDCSTCTHVGPRGPKVWVQTVPETGAEDSGLGTPTLPTEEFTADVAIITIPFSALRQVEIAPLFSYGKRRAITELHYDAATKVLLEFSRRWWEFDENDWERELEGMRPGLYRSYLDIKGQPDRPATGATGGGSLSDNANRFMYYPSHSTPNSQGGIVLAVYCWADDALRWDSQDNNERYANALRGLQAVHGKRIEAFYTGGAQTQSWLRNRYACGEASVLMPGQFVRLYPHVPTPEGPIHFAGDHTSLKPAWIEGALESALRSALEVNG